jgi:UDP-N-acetylmuramyl pentapeptide phosphotransferase/UDP-N-acetylglucosamine-1-phosphate transferase
VDRLRPPINILVAFGVPLIVSLVLTALLIRLAPRLGLIDQPSARKVHTRPTPKGGGIAIFLAFVFTVFLGGTLPRDGFLFFSWRPPPRLSFSA